MGNKVGLITKFIRAWKGFRTFNAMETKSRTIVFYAEDGNAWEHFKPIIRALVKDGQYPVCYLTSSLDDRVLELKDSKIIPIFIGDGVWLNILFRILKAVVMIVTVPDLDKFYLKRSFHPTHYVYIFHSMVSTHMIYRKGAFDHYDSIFCVGPHHEAEIRQTEKLYDLPAKKLIKHGYGRLCTLMEDNRAKRPTVPPFYENNKARVLIAPSWGPTGLLENCGIELIEVLLLTGHHVTVRPHPQTRRNYPEKLEAIKSKFQSNRSFLYEDNNLSWESFYSAHIMISDWSGAALEFAFSLERPVLYIDVPRKLNNPEYDLTHQNPLEVEMRSKIGKILSPDSLEQAGYCVEEMATKLRSYSEGIRIARSQWIYNVSCSGEKGAAAILEIVNSSKVQGNIEKI